MEELPRKQWNSLIDEYLETGKIEIAKVDWEALSKDQRKIISEIKKSIKRRKRKQYGNRF